MVLNRQADKRWPDTLCGVIKQRKQFSWYNSAIKWMPRDEIDWVPYTIAKIKAPEDLVAMNLAMELAIEYFYHTPDDASYGADHYMRYDLWQTHTVSWGECLFCMVGIKGNHVFFDIQPDGVYLENLYVEDDYIPN